MLKRSVVVWAVLATAGVAGCKGTTWQPFGYQPAKYQRIQAQRFDPYPEPGVGPAIPDTRPRDFENPPPQPARARWLDFGRYRYGGGQ